MRAPLAMTFATLALLLAGCGGHAPAKPERPRHPVVVIGVDGGEWSVIRELWGKGKLPHLRRIAERGVATVLRTDYGMSPVIWTTIATGRRPREHGIVDFVVPTSRGEVPISSTVRRVPALWNMATTAGLRVAVVSWWASWPAEPVNGIVVSDRALLGVPEGVWPPSFAPRLVELRRQAAARPNRFGGNPATRERDQVTEQVAAALAREGFDLTLVYFRGVDIASHNYWRYFRPAGFPEPDPAMAAAHGDEVPRVYEATDAAIGRIAAAAPQANLIVVSDHGFRRLPGEEAIVSLSFDRVLERLGYLAYGRRGQVDLDRTRIRTWSSPTARLKRLRYCLAGRDPGGRVLPDERAALRAALERDLARLTWPGGEPAFRLRDPRPREAQEGADLVVAMLAGAEAPLYLDRRPQPGLVQVVARISGTHGGNTNGIFFAVGPDVRRGAALEQIHVQDLAPTILFALGLPVADDFAGKPQVELFTPELRRRQPLRRIRTWGAPRSGRTTMSTADQELVRELRALGYL